MSDRRTTHVRAPLEAKEKFNRWSKEASIIEGKDIKTPDVLLRIAKSDIVYQKFIEDSQKRWRKTHEQ